MKALKCEMCGSTNIVKEEGIYICKSCGTKYSIEEAKKMFNEAIEVTGSVKIDTSSELDNLYQLARRAKDSENIDNALKYYEMILIKDADYWEANFYVIYYKAMSCKIIEIIDSAININNSIPFILEIIQKNSLENENEVIEEVVQRIIIVTNMLYNASVNHYNNIDASIRFREEYTIECKNSMIAAIDIMYTLGNELERIFEGKYQKYSVMSWEKGINLSKGLLTQSNVKTYISLEGTKSLIMEYVNKIHKYDPSFETPEVTKSGCYIATSVYGSYDCPEVWTLRRFRDLFLSKNFLGRQFIKIYYSISPIIVRKFGGKLWFNLFFKRILNSFVRKLKEKGYKDIHYQD